VTSRVAGIFVKMEAERNNYILFWREVARVQRRESKFPKAGRRAMNAKERFAKQKWLRLIAKDSSK
jgi:hypothetical protein